MADDDRMPITATAGPWRGWVLTLPRDEAEQAVAEGWAVARGEPPFDMAVPPDEFPYQTSTGRRRAMRAALAWHEKFLARTQ